jgi:hypothetical protein
MPQRMVDILEDSWNQIWNGIESIYSTINMLPIKASANLDVKADITKPTDKIILTLCKYLHIPVSIVTRPGTTISKALSIFEEVLNQKKLDLKFKGELRRPSKYVGTYSSR